MDRRILLEKLEQVGQLTVLGKPGSIRGYAVSRRFGRGHVIGPVVAADAADAQALIKDAFSKLPNEFVRVDTPTHLGLGSWLEEEGLKRVDTVSSMVRGALPEVSGSSRLFALCSQSLG
jgi:hypothetical protein